MCQPEYKVARLSEATIITTHGSESRATLTLSNAADDEGELYISSDESPDNQELVASVKRGRSGIGNESGRSNWRAWGTNPSAVSESIRLEAGKRYAVKALMKEDSGQDHLSVTWQMPGDEPPKPGDPPIPGEYLEFEIK